MITKKLLSGSHPYIPGLSGAVEVDWLEGEPPGASDRRLRMHEKENPPPDVIWNPLAGPFLMASKDEEALLMGLLWDLEGVPIRPGEPRRARARYVAAEVGPGTVMVYRAAREMRCE